MKKFLNTVKAEIKEFKHKPHNQASNAVKGSHQDGRTLQQPIVHEQGLLQPPSATDIYRYRYHHGVNFGSIFVLEKWLWPTLFEDNSKGDSELDAAESQIEKYGLQIAKQHFETFWDEQVQGKNWPWLWNWLKDRGVTSIRLPIGYFSLGPKFCKGTPFEKVAPIYENAWSYVKKFVMLASTYGIGVLIDLHALPGGANGDAHSGTSSHKAELWNSSFNRNLAKACLEHIAYQCAHDIDLMENVIGLQLVNEAMQNATGMYQFYDMVRDAVYQNHPSLPLYISDAWDLSTALNYTLKVNEPNKNPIIVDTHKYYCFSDNDKKCSPRQIIDKVDIPELVQGQSNSLIVGEYSCVMDGQTWGSSNNQERADNVKAFGQRQSQMWQTKSGGCFFWTMGMAWFPGGEWGFKEQNDKLAIQPPAHYNDDINNIRARIQQAEAVRPNFREHAIAGHVRYWDNVAHGERMEHFRFEDGWNLGYSDAIAFFQFRATCQGNASRSGADRIGLLDLWVARRFAEYQARENKKSPGQNTKYFWEWQHGYAQGIRSFQEFVG